MQAKPETLSLAMIYVTTQSKKEAENIADVLIQARLIACCNIIDGVVSKYRWNGLQQGSQVLMIMKTRASLFEMITQTVKQNHSCAVPEIVAVPILAASPDYTKWVLENTLSQQVCQKQS